jgi:acetyltransferase-like isoleucine patch superfamily enzyme
MPAAQRLPNDWYPGEIPANVLIDSTAWVGSSYNFARFHSEQTIGATIGRGAALDATVLDVGPRGKVIIGEFAMVTTAYILCDLEVEIGPYSMLSWNAVLMDNYRDWAASWDTSSGLSRIAHARPVRLERNTWIGFEACVLPGVTIGEGSIVGARAVAAEDVPPYVIVAGNPARIIRHLPHK